MFTHMSVKAGIKFFGSKVVAIMIKCFRQTDKGRMTGKPFVTPINTDTLSFDDKSKTLESVNLTKEKKCGKIKGRSCAYGSKKKKILRRKRASFHLRCI